VPAAAGARHARPRAESLSDFRKLLPDLLSALANTESFSLPPAEPCAAFLRLENAAHQARGRSCLELAVSELLAQRDNQARAYFEASLEHFVFSAFLASEVSSSEKRMIDDFIRVVVDNLYSLQGG
jgi:hypothetical protein